MAETKKAGTDEVNEQQRWAVPLATIGPVDMPAANFDSLREHLKSIDRYIPTVADGREQITVTIIFNRAYEEGDVVWLTPCGACGGDRGVCGCP